MFNRFIGNQRTLCFLGGILSATLGVKLLKCESSRRLCVKGMAHGMRLHKDALEAFQNMKEEAADICHDAKEQNANKQNAEE